MPEEFVLRVVRYLFFYHQMQHHVRQDEHQSCHSNAINVPEECVVFVVELVLGWDVVVERGGDPTLPWFRIYCDVLILNFAEAKECNFEDRGEQKGGNINVDPNFLEVVHDMGPPSLQADEKQGKPDVNDSPRYNTKESP